MSTLFETAEHLVKTRILGTRKGSEEPAFQHSLRVAQKIRELGFPDEVILAAMLHDIIEDGATSADELASLGFSPRTVDLVKLCSHDDAIEGGDARWVKMMAGLIDARDAEAWSIKCADLNDNLQSSHLLSDDRRRFMREAKAPFLLRLSWHVIADTPIWSELKHTSDSLRMSTHAG